MAASAHQKTLKTNGLWSLYKQKALFKRSYWSGQGELGKGCQCLNNLILWWLSQNGSALCHESDHGHVNDHESHHENNRVHLLSFGLHNKTKKH